MKGLYETILSINSILESKINSTRYACFKVDNSTAPRDLFIAFCRKVAEEAERCYCVGEL